MVPDITPEERAIEVDTIDNGIGAIARLRQGVAKRTNGEHPATRSDDIAVGIELRSRVEDFHVAPAIRLQA